LLSLGSLLGSFINSPTQIVRLPVSSPLAGGLPD
jgi:hypothetical protein